MSTRHGLRNIGAVAARVEFLLGKASILSAEQARDAAKKALATAALGGDPQAAKADRRAKDEISLRSVIDEYLLAKKPNLRPRSYIEVERFLTGYYFKPLHTMAVDVVSRKDIASRLLVVTREFGLGRCRACADRT